MTHPAPKTATEKVQGDPYGTPNSVDYPLSADEWEVLELQLSAGPWCIAFTSAFIGQLVIVVRTALTSNHEQPPINDSIWRFMATFEGLTLLVLGSLALATLLLSVFGRKHRERRELRKFLHDIFESARREKREKFGAPQ